MVIKKLSKPVVETSKEKEKKEPSSAPKNTSTTSSAPKNTYSTPIPSKSNIVLKSKDAKSKDCVRFTLNDWSSDKCSTCKFYQVKTKGSNLILRGSLTADNTILSTENHGSIPNGAIISATLSYVEGHYSICNGGDYLDNKGDNIEGWIVSGNFLVPLES